MPKPIWPVYASLARQDFASRQQLENAAGDGQAVLPRRCWAMMAANRSRPAQSEFLLHYGHHLMAVSGCATSTQAISSIPNEITPIISITQVQPINVTFNLCRRTTCPSITRAMAQQPLKVIAYASDDKNRPG